MTPNLADTAERRSPFEFDPHENLAVSTAVGKGYHTKIPAGVRIHSTKESAWAAYWFLGAGEADKAVKIIERLLSLQITDPTSKHFGIWSWYLEESVEEMAPADWNWADFIGMELLEILDRYEKLVGPDLAARTLKAVEMAAWSIFRRNIDFNYANICTMGAVVCLLAGEKLGHALLVSYGATRLHNQRVEAERVGAVPEYNSPMYTMILIEELERALRMVRHEGARADAAWLHRLAWKQTAEHFHPPTQQWCGPQSRCYTPWLVPTPLARRLGFMLKARNADGSVTETAPPQVEDHPTLPVPPEFPDRFRSLPADVPYQHTQIWTRDPQGKPLKVGTTWFTPQACIGSINQETTWDQRRVLTAYWRTKLDLAARFRARILHNGHDFESGIIRAQQEGPRVLCGFQFVTNGGDFHPLFDIPANGVFRTHDLRLRFEAEGLGMAVHQLDSKVFEISTGDQRIVIHAGIARFHGQEVTWQPGREGDRCWVDAIFHEGGDMEFSPMEAGECNAYAGVELLGADESPTVVGVTETTEVGRRRITWDLESTLEVVLDQTSQSRTESV